jgi:hypothetical protein
MRNFYTKKIFFIIVSTFWIDKIQFFCENVMYVAVTVRSVVEGVVHNAFDYAPDSIPLFNF